MSRRYILILGAMKSGTTTLFDHLARHPEIVPAYPKEPGFFAFDEQFEKGLDWYDGLFQADEQDPRWRLDGSTDYAKAPFVTGVADRMAKVPEAEFRLLYIMRDPVARLESHARHVQRTRKEIGQHVSPRPDHGLDAGLSPVSLAISDYVAQLSVWQASFDAGHLHCLTLEALSAAPDETMAAVWQFLGLSPIAAPLPQSNQAGSKAAMPGAAQKLDELASRLGIGAVIPSRLKSALRDRLSKPVTVDGRFRFSDEERMAIRALYAPMIDILRARYGVDTSPWTDGIG